MSLQNAIARRLGLSKKKSKPTGHKDRGSEMHKRAEDDFRRRAADYSRSQTEKAAPRGQMRFNPGTRLDTSQVSDQRMPNNARQPGDRKTWKPDSEEARRRKESDQKLRSPKTTGGPVGIRGGGGSSVSRSGGVSRKALQRRLMRAGK